MHLVRECGRARNQTMIIVTMQNASIAIMLMIAAILLATSIQMSHAMEGQKEQQQQQQPPLEATTIKANIITTQTTANTSASTAIATTVTMAMTTAADQIGSQEMWERVFLHNNNDGEELATMQNGIVNNINNNGRQQNKQADSSKLINATNTNAATATATSKSVNGGQQQSQKTFHQYCLAHRNSFADLITLVLYTIVCIVGLFGNTLVIYVVLRFSKMQTVTNIYILNLAIADECFLIGIPFLLYTMRICSWKFGEFMCKAYMVSTSITQFTSSIFLLIMSADRYLAVCHPIASPKYRTLHIAKIVSALAWLTSAILMTPVILYASTVSQEDGINLSCNIEWPEMYKKHSGTTFILYTFMLGFATPLVFILCFYYMVIRKLHTVGSKHKSKEKKRSHRKVTRLVLTVITVYICCWLPHWISQVALINSNPAKSDLSRLEILIFLLLGCLVYSNSAMNPILYAFLSDNFRKSFFKAFTCMAQQEVNAQLQLEPSVFTKQGSRRQRSGAGGSGAGPGGAAGTKRLMNSNSKLKSKSTKSNASKTITTGNNNSSATTSSTTTAEKSGAIMGTTEPTRLPVVVSEHVILMSSNQEQDSSCSMFMNHEKLRTETTTILQTDL